MNCSHNKIKTKYIGYKKCTLCHTWFFTDKKERDKKYKDIQDTIKDK